MATSEKEPPADAGRTQKRRWSGWDVLAILVMVGIAAALLLPEIRVGTMTECTCAVCRVGRIDRTFFGRSTSELVETPCSEWYRDNVEASHEHVWIRRSGGSGLNLFGRTISSTPGPENPIWQITPAEQVELYIRSADKLATKRAFAEMDRWSPGEAGGRADRFVDAIKAWKDSGFIGSWEKWLPDEGRSQSDER